MQSDPAIQCTLITPFTSGAATLCATLYAAARQVSAGRDRLVIEMAAQLLHSYCVEMAIGSEAANDRVISDL